MSKKVLVISTSLRKNSNSERLAQEFARGARDAGHEVELISLRGRQIGFCTGCMACQKLGRCVQRDDASDIAGRMLVSDVIAFATPIYYYEMAGQMKVLLDRMNPLYGQDYAFRDVYMLSTAAEAEPDVPARAESGLDGWVECFERAHVAGRLFAGGVTDAGEIEGNAKLDEAYNLGKGV